MDIIFEDSDLLIVDDFLSNPGKVRTQGLKAKFIDWAAPDGQTYKRVSPQTIPEVVDALNRVMGRPIQLLGMGFRLNYQEETPNREIHSDLGWGTHAAVLYLSEPPSGVQSGTAFWKHLESGYDRIAPGDVAALHAVEGDWDDPEKWEQTRFVSCKENSCIIYKSELFHSRWPFAAYGTKPQDGRLTVVAFFS